MYLYYNKIKIIEERRVAIYRFLIIYNRSLLKFLSMIVKLPRMLIQKQSEPIMNYDI